MKLKFVNTTSSKSEQTEIHRTVHTYITRRLLTRRLTSPYYSLPNVDQKRKQPKSSRIRVDAHSSDFPYTHIYIYTSHDTLYVTLIRVPTTEAVCTCTAGSKRGWYIHIPGKPRWGIYTNDRLRRCIAKKTCVCARGWSSHVELAIGVGIFHAADEISPLTLGVECDGRWRLTAWDVDVGLLVAAKIVVERICVWKAVWFAWQMFG